MFDLLEEIADEYLEKLYNKIVHTGEVPSDWHKSIIVNSFKGKSDALLWQGHEDVWKSFRKNY